MRLVTLSGAPAEGFVFQQDDSILALMKDLPNTDGSVELLDCKIDKDKDGSDMLRVYFRFTNNTGEETSFFMAYDIYAMQDGYGLSTAYPATELQEDQNFTEDIAPGGSIECAATYVIRTDSPVAILLKDSWDWDAEVFGDIVKFE